MRAIAPAGTVAIAAIALWLATGVGGDEIARYVGYELAFVIGPGWLVGRAISRDTRSRLWQLALGWPLGLTLEVLAFSLTAALGARDLFLAYPPVVALAALTVIAARRRRAEPRVNDANDADRAGAPLFSSGQAWALAGVCLVAFSSIALLLIAHSPLPGTVPQVSYERDLLFHISLAADAKHHWPIGLPEGAGVSLNYHVFFHIHAAAISQVTGIGLPVLFLRLAVFPLVALIVLQMGLVGRALTGIPWAGPIAAALMLLVAELDLVIPELTPFFGRTDVWLSASQSTLLGLVFFIPLIGLLGALLDERVAARLGSPDRRALWLLTALLLVGASGSKGVAVPMLAGGLGLYALVGWVRRRVADRTALAAFGLCAAVAAASSVVLYGGDAGALRFGVGQIYGLMPGLETIRPVIPDSLEIPFWGIGAIAATLLHFGPSLLGLYWAVGRGRPALPPAQLLALCILAAGLPAWFLLIDDSGDNYYFSAYGVIAAAPVAAAGLCYGLGDWARGPAGPKRRALSLTGAWVVLLLALAALGWHWVLDGHPSWPYALVYPVFAVGILLMVAFARRAPASERPWRTALVVLAILVPAGLDLILDSAPEAARAQIEGRPLYDASGYDGVTPLDYSTAVWIRDHLDDDAVYAVPDPATAEGPAAGPQDAMFPAFSEHRAFYAGWAYLAHGVGLTDTVERRRYPYRHRYRLQERVYNRGDLAALRVMEDRYGVTHLVIDRASDPVPAALYREGRVVHSNAKYDVLELRAP